MKKILAMLLTVLMLLSMAACAPTGTLKPGITGESTGSTEQSETNGTDQTAPSDSQPTDSTPTDPTQSEPAAPETKPTEPTAPETKPTEPTPTEPTLPDDPNALYTRAELEAMSTKVNGWGLGPSKGENNRPVDGINAQKKYGKYDAYFIGPDNGEVYLTFDEGYENGYTSKILDVLKEKDVKAVFFVTKPYCKSHPELVQRMIDEGHVVGNHSVNHKSMPKLSIDEMEDEVMGLHEYVLEKFGYEMTLFRPPMGEFSEQSLAVLQNLGYKTVNWSFAYYDYDPDNQPANDKAFDKVMDWAHSGALYLLHAVSKTNTEILGDVIDALRAEGYKLELFQ